MMMFYILFVLYNGIFIPLFYSAIRIAAIFNPKVRLGLSGRRMLFATLAEKLNRLPAAKPRIWIHISSLGEFEQAKPVIRSIRTEIPDAQIVLSFFSPSGFIPAQKYAAADLITYLPLDSWRQARKFIQLVKPRLHLIIRHDIWPNLQWRLQREKIPSFLVDASLTPRSLRALRCSRIFLKSIYSTFTEIHVTDADNGAHFRRIFPHEQKIYVSGDTRFDQVCERALESGKIDSLQKSGFFRRDACFVAGSTWPSDEKVILAPLIDALKAHSDFNLIIAPHETTEEHLLSIETLLRDHRIPWVRLSSFDARMKNFQVLLIDRIGLLANLYALGKMAYVGGGFGPGVHNVLEPAAHTCAVLFGPRHLNSLEAMALDKRGGGEAITVAEQLRHQLVLLLEHPQRVEEMGRKAREMVEENVGASQRIVERIKMELQ